LINWILWTSIFYRTSMFFENIVQSSNIHVLQEPDTVNRAKLLKKLQEIGLSGTFLRNIKALYSRTDYKIKLKNRVLDAISSNLGLKQGCPLSPILFNIYISDLDKYLTDNNRSSPTLHDTVISHFLYADDLVIVATSKEGLQEKLEGQANLQRKKI
jgi:hypothetical protein